jgi:hypothetical protein
MPASRRDASWRTSPRLAYQVRSIGMWAFPAKNREMRNHAGLDARARHILARAVGWIHRRNWLKTCPLFSLGSGETSFVLQDGGAFLAQIPGGLSQQLQQNRFQAPGTGHLVSGQPGRKLNPVVLHQVAVMASQEGHGVGQVGR